MVVALGVLFALKGVGERAFYHWARRDYRPLIPALDGRAVVLDDTSSE
jgi:hypothetical protein